MSDGYVVAQHNGQGGTRLSFHENKRYVMIMGILLAVVLVLILLIYFLALRESSDPWERAYNQAMGRGSGSWAGIGMLIGGVIGTIWGVIQIVDIMNAPKKMIALFNERQMHGPGAHPGMPGQPQPAFPGAPGGFPPHQPQGGGFSPAGPQGGFPPQGPHGGPQLGKGPGGMPPHQLFPPQGGFPPAPPQGGFPPPQPAQPGAGAHEAKLRELAQLRDSGVITPADYEQMKASLEAKRS